MACFSGVSTLWARQLRRIYTITPFSASQRLHPPITFCNSQLWTDFSLQSALSMSEHARSSETGPVSRTSTYIRECLASVSSQSRINCCRSTLFCLPETMLPRPRLGSCVETQPVLCTARGRVVDRPGLGSIDTVLIHTGSWKR